MGKPTVIGLGRRDDAQRLDTCDLRGDDIHDHAAGVHRTAARDVESDTGNRQPPLGDGSSRDDDGCRVDPPLIGMHQPCTTDGFLQRGAHLGVQGFGSRRDRPSWNAQVGGCDPVETLRPLDDRVGTAVTHVVDHRANPLRRLLHVEGGTGQHRPRIVGLATQVDQSQHDGKSRSSAPIPRASYPGRVTTEPDPLRSTPASEVLPTFPLGTVLVPGLVLPLHIFEPRYRDLVQGLLELPESERRFLVVAIRAGHEVGTRAMPDLYDLGTVASVREITPLEDGRFDLVTVGSTRARIDAVLEDRSYLQARVSTIPEQPGDQADALAPLVRAEFATYRALLTESDESFEDLPEDPGVLSYLIAAAIVLDLPDRQALLEIPDDTARLQAELRRLRHEIALLRVLPSLPATDLRSVPPSPN